VKPKTDPSDYMLKFGPFRRCTLENIARQKDGLMYLVDLQERDMRRSFLFEDTRDALHTFLMQERWREVLPEARERAKKRRKARSNEFKDKLFGFQPEHPAFEYGL
jgi:hypothetical protein